MIEINGDLFYLNNNGLLDRNDGPAIEFANGDKYWFSNGRIHKDDGPAFISSTGVKEYWIRGKRALGEEIRNIKRNGWLNEILD